MEPGPVKRPRDWLGWVNQAATKAELDAIRKSVHRGSPYGGPAWTESTAKALGLESPLRPRGRPKTSEEKEDAQ